MRTTISLDDQLAKQVRRAAEVNGVSVSAFIARVLDDVLKRQEEPPAPPFRLLTVKGGRPRSGVDLDAIRALETHDDEAQFGRSHR